MAILATACTSAGYVRLLSRHLLGLVQVEQLIQYDVVTTSFQCESRDPPQPGGVHQPLIFLYSPFVSFWRIYVVALVFCPAPGNTLTQGEFVHLN